MIPQYYRTHVIAYVSLGVYAVLFRGEQVAVVGSTCEGRALIDRLNWSQA